MSAPQGLGMHSQELLEESAEGEALQVSAVVASCMHTYIHTYIYTYIHTYIYNAYIDTYYILSRCISYNFKRTAQHILLDVFMDTSFYYMLMLAFHYFA